MKRFVSIALSILMVLTIIPAFTAGATSVGEHAHKWVRGEGYAPSCTEPGQYLEYCELCYERRTVTVPALGHYFPNPWTTMVEPTCTDVGREMNTCVRVYYGDPCGYEWWRDIPALGHDWGEWYVVKAPTVDEDGVEERKCNRCGITEQRPLHIEDYDGGAALALSVGFDKDRVYKADEVVNLACTVTNTGLIPLRIEYVHMTFMNDEDKLVSSPLVDETLEPGKSIVATIQYTTTQEDEDRGFVSVNLHAIGRDLDKPGPENSVMSNEVPAVINLDGAMDHSCVVEKFVWTTPENGSYFVEGEKITYEITVTNRFDTPVHDIYVVDYPDAEYEKNYTLGVIDELAPYEHKSYITYYTVTVLDCARGYHINIASAEGGGSNVSYDKVISPCGDSPMVTLYKSELSVPANGVYYTPGEKIEYRVVLTNNGNGTLTQVSIDDQIAVPAYLYYDSVAPHDSVSETVTYTVTAEDAERGFCINSAFADFTVEDPQYAGLSYVESNEVKSPCGLDGLMIEKAEISSPANGKFYTESETIYYRITVKNDGTSALHDVWVFDIPEGWEIGDALDSGITLAPGEQRQYDYAYTVTAGDCEQGVVHNYASVSWQDPENPDEEKHSESNIVESPCGKLNELLITKTVTSTPANGEYYADGEEITYLIEVWNLADYPLYYLEVYDNPNDNEFAAELLGKTDVFDSHAYLSYTHSHMVDIDDIVNSPYPNSATAFWSSDDAGGVVNYDDGSRHELTSNVVESLCGEHEKTVLIHKYITSTPANGEYYVEGETIRYGIFVQNYSGVKVERFTLHDTNLSDSELNPPNGYFDGLDLYESYFPFYDYTVTAEDVLMGVIYNTASVEWTDAEGNTGMNWSNTCEAKTGGEIPGIDDVTVTKREISTPANGVAYEVGEQVYYEVTVTNHYHTIAENVVVSDPLKGAGDEAILGTIDILHMDESYTYVFVYTVTEEDAAVAFVLNQSNAAWNDGRTREAHISVSNIVRVPVMQIIPPVRYNVSVVKFEYSTPPNGAYYTEGQLISYGIYVVNDSDEPIENVIIFDDLYDTNWVGDNKVGGVYKVGAGEKSPTAYFDHAVTAEDVENGYVKNQACAYWTPVGGFGDEASEAWSNTVVVTVGKDEEKVNEVPMSLTKTVVSSPSADPNFYVKDETVYYLITYVNNSDYDVTIRYVKDEAIKMSGNETNYLGSDIPVAAHTSATFPFSYTVTASDIPFDITNTVLMQVDAYVDGALKTYFPYDEVTVHTGDKPIPPVLEPKPMPVVIKYETSYPKNGKFYQEGEEIEYDVVVYNYTGRSFSDIKGYDILLTDSGFYFGGMASLGDTPATMHILYKVDASDIPLKNVYNIAWVTMFDDKYGESVTLYSNEVIVPVGEGDSDTPSPGKTCCEYRLIAEGEGAWVYENTFCAEHASVEAAVSNLLENAVERGNEDEAWKTAAEIWRGSLDSEYDRLIIDAQEAMRTALERDKSVFVSYLNALADRLRLEGKTEVEVNKALVDALRDRVCELCYTAGTAPEARKDLSGKAEQDAHRPAAVYCEVTYTAGKTDFIKSVSLCDRHMPLLKAINRLLLSADSDETRMIAQQKARAYWLSQVEMQYNTLLSGAEPMYRHMLLVEKAAFLAVADQREALYAAYYPGDDLLAKDLASRLLTEKALHMCE